MVEYLQLDSSNVHASVYRIIGGQHDGLDRYIVSTPETRLICNRPEIMGCDYAEYMRNGMVSILRTLPFVPHLLQHTPETSISVLNILRGGLNFDLRQALYLAYGITRHSSSFVSSQRFKEKDHWIIREDTYRKLNFGPQAVIFIGDVVATGSTVVHSLKILANHLAQTPDSIKSLVFFTIGCERTEAVLAEYDAVFRKLSSTYEATYIVYLEGRFRLVNDNTNLHIGIPGTDLVRFDCLLSPEFELSQYEDIRYPLERCTIYDAGSRAFNIPEYLEDVTNYWRLVRELACQGVTLASALKERWSEEEYSDYDNFCQTKQIWQGIDPNLIHRLHSAYRRRWAEPFLSQAQTTDALLRLCDARLEELSRPPQLKSSAHHNAGLSSPFEVACY